MFKISRYLTWVKIFGSALKQSWQPLAMLVFVMCIATIVFSSALYYAEREAINPLTHKPNVLSIPDAFWWCIITMTTVGYGDKVPITPWGKLIAAVTSLCGILVLAVPITVISTNFNEQYASVKKRQERIRAKMLLLKNQFKKRRYGEVLTASVLSPKVPRELWRGVVWGHSCACFTEAAWMQCWTR